MKETFRHLVADFCLVHEWPYFLSGAIVGYKKLEHLDTSSQRILGTIIFHGTNTDFSELMFIGSLGLMVVEY